MAGCHFRCGNAGAVFLASFRWQNLLNTHLINEVFSFQASYMRPLCVVRKVSTNPLRHCKDETAITHV